MAAKPKGKENTAIQLTQNPFKIEDELDMLFSYTQNGYETYKEEGESGTLLKTDGTVVTKFPSEKLCRENFEALKRKMSKSGTFASLQYSDLTLEAYKIGIKIEGKLEYVAPKALIDFLCNARQEVKYDPERIFFEFLDSKQHKNFVRITFDKIKGQKTLLLDVAVESNDPKYAQKTIKKVQEILKK